MTACLALLRGGFLRNLHYRLAHMLNNFGSAIFGFIYISMWQAAAHGRSLGAFTPAALVHYVAINQALLWITTFMARGLHIGTWIRTGQIALEMQRPLPFFVRVLSEEYGHLLYNLLYRSLPLAALFFVLGDFTVAPLAHPTVVAAFLSALVLATYTGLCLNYLVGMSAFWLTEIRFAHILLYSLATVTSGTVIPLSLMPGFAARIASALPFATLSNFPDTVYLGMATAAAWIQPILWVFLLTIACLFITWRAKRRLEVQGG